MIKDLIKKNRSYRRFHQDRRVDVATLRELVDLARLTGSAGNLQPLRYILAGDPQINEQIFACLGWAAYLKNWPGPEAGEQPPAYIIILSDTAKANDYIGYDCGIASQSILLGAVEKGLAGCMLGSINRKKLRNILDIETQFKILLVIALGEPQEEIVIETVGQDNDIRYWRDDKGIHHVPKRKLSDVIVASY
ncbi:MAG: nitroreductase family protein [Candidatus Desulfatibia sp.]|uniref:nitroreductase family protein n=1 Tax=Candidatus Desulfatibia sp. TaxID=3101189 RepID=UPI002F33D1C7